MAANSNLLTWWHAPLLKTCVLKLSTHFMSWRPNHLLQELAAKAEVAAQLSLFTACHNTRVQYPIFSTFLLQELAAKAEVAAQRAKEAAAHRKEFIAERCNAARDARNLRNRGAVIGCMAVCEAAAVHVWEWHAEGVQAHWLQLPFSGWAVSHAVLQACCASTSGWCGNRTLATSWHCLTFVCLLLYLLIQACCASTSGWRGSATRPRMTTERCAWRPSRWVLHSRGNGWCTGLVWVPVWPSDAPGGIQDGCCDFEAYQERLHGPLQSDKHPRPLFPATLLRLSPSNAQAHDFEAYQEMLPATPFYSRT